MATKRVFVDPDNDTEIDIAKRTTVELDRGQRASVFRFMYYAYSGILTRLFPNPEPEITRNIHTSNQIMNIVHTAHNALRQDANNSGGLPDTIKGREMTVTHLGVQHTMPAAEALKIVKDSAARVQLDYVKPVDRDSRHWWGTAAPIMTFFSMNSARRNELRVGHSTFPVKKSTTGNTTTERLVQSSTYGVLPPHHVLCSGISYNPSKRASMAQSVGVITAAVSLASTTNTQFQRKWKEALNRAAGHVPFISQLSNAIAGQRASAVAGTISALADIMLVITSRHAHRATFPFCFYQTLVDSDFVIPKRTPSEDKPVEQAAKKTKPATESTPPSESSSTETAAEMEVTLPAKDLRMMDIADALDFSGKGMIWFHNAAAKFIWTFPQTESSDANMIAQINFHAIFDTFSEDLGVLETITNCNSWLRRSDLAGCFRGLGSSKKATKFYLPSFILYSKLSSASGTDYLAGSASQIVAAPVFAGIRNVQYLELLRGRLTSHGNVMPSSMSLQGIEAALQRLKAVLDQKVNSNQGRTRVGTVPWRVPEGNNFPFADGPESTTIVTASNKFFLADNIQ